MIGLGANNEDTGKQLETLTRSILEHRGYSNLAVNVITSGGQEIDVTADYTIPVPGESQTRRLIAECKAYQHPVAMPDWLKFLGKVFVEEARLNQEITGLFVALSGVNGPVQGNYDEIRQHKKNISLLTGEGLLTELQSVYHLAPRSQVIERLHTLTDRQYLRVEPAYYNQAVYWIFTFSDSEYAILRGSGELPSEAEINTLSSPIENRLGVNSYVDLSAEAQAQEQLRQIKKAVVAKIADVGGALRREQLPMPPNADEALLDRSLRELANFNWCTISDDEIAFSHRDDTQIEHYEQLSAILRFMFDGPLSSDVFRMFFCSDYVQSRLNDRYLDYVSKIQGELPITEDLRQTILKVVRLSPSACLQSVSPEPLIVVHRQEQNLNYDSDEDDRRILKRQLLTYLARDFEQISFTEYFYESCDLREIETVQEIIVKSREQPEIREAVRMRRGIGKAHERHGGGYVHILILDHTPQPWENGGFGYSDSEDG